MVEGVVGQHAAESLEESSGLGKPVDLFGQPGRGCGQEGDLFEGVVGDGGQSAVGGGFVSVGQGGPGLEDRARLAGFGLAVISGLLAVAFAGCLGVAGAGELSICSGFVGGGVVAAGSEHQHW